jgi:hypothetical protein
LLLLVAAACCCWPAANHTYGDIVTNKGKWGRGVTIGGGEHWPCMLVGGGGIASGRLACKRRRPPPLLHDAQLPRSEGRAPLCMYTWALAAQQLQLLGTWEVGRTWDSGDEKGGGGVIWVGIHLLSTGGKVCAQNPCGCPKWV